MSASETLKHGDEFPYDGGARFWNGDGDNPPPPKDWAHRAARGVLAELNNRRGLNHILDELDHDLRREIVRKIAAIIRATSP